MDKMNIFIIGYRCTGKTSVAECVSLSIGWRFVDTDALLMENRGQSVSEIVENGGWALFREIEKQTLKDICRQEGQVVATGGGIVLDKENIELMRKNGIVIWLRADPDTILSRMIGDSNTVSLRPALTDQDLMSEIRQTLSERRPLYKKAMTRAIDTDDKTIPDVASEICTLLKEYKTIV